jgi:hypothetical protein
VTFYHHRPQHHRRRPTARQRGSVLVLVLAVASLVGIIGLSALLAVRLQHRNLQLRHEALQAQRLADAGLQWVHLRLSDDDDWRNTYTHDVWTADQNMAGGRVRFRLADEGADLDGDLSDDETDPARLTVRAAVGRAVRLVSLRLDPQQQLGPNLAQNGDLETGDAAPFVPIYAGYSQVEASRDNPGRGVYALHVRDRSFTAAGTQIDLTDELTEPGTYRVSGRVRTADAAGPMQISSVEPGFLNLPITRSVAIPAQTTWTRFDADLTFQFDDPAPSYLYVSFATQTGTQNFWLDEVQIRRLDRVDPPVVRGSYRRELDP